MPGSLRLYPLANTARRLRRRSGRWSARKDNVVETHGTMRSIRLQGWLEKYSVSAPRWRKNWRSRLLVLWTVSGTTRSAGTRARWRGRWMLPRAG